MSYPDKSAADRIATPQERQKVDNLLNNVAGDISSGLAAVDEQTRQLMLSIYKPYIDFRGQALFDFGRGLQSIDNISTNLGESLQNVNIQLGETLKPVSKFLGSTIGTLANVLNDPLGALEQVPRTLFDTIGKISPRFARKLDATLRKYKLDNIKNFPGSIAGSIRSLVGTLDALLSLPVILISDIYFGFMTIMNAISREIDQVIATIYKAIFGPEGLLDQIGIPIADILSILQDISDIASQVSGITSIFAGANQISGILNQVTSVTTSIESFINNPLDLAFAYLPPQVSEGLYLVRNPQEIINRLIPPEASALFAQASQILGVGFNGNMGYGLGSILKTLENGVVSSVLSNFSNQYPILTPLVNSVTPKGGLAGVLPPGYTSWVANPAVAVAASNKVPSGPADPLLGSASAGVKRGNNIDQPSGE